MHEGGGGNLIINKPCPTCASRSGDAEAGTDGCKAGTHLGKTRSRDGALGHKQSPVGLVWASTHPIVTSAPSLSCNGGDRPEGAITSIDPTGQQRACSASLPTLPPFHPPTSSLSCHSLDVRSKVQYLAASLANPARQGRAKVRQAPLLCISPAKEPQEEEALFIHVSLSCHTHISGPLGAAPA